MEYLEKIEIDNVITLGDHVKRSLFAFNVHEVSAFLKLDQISLFKMGFSDEDRLLLSDVINRENQKARDEAMARLTALRSQDSRRIDQLEQQNQHLMTMMQHFLNQLNSPTTTAATTIVSPIASSALSFSASAQSRSFSAPTAAPTGNHPPSSVESSVNAAAQIFGQQCAVFPLSHNSKSQASQQGAESSEPVDEAASNVDVALGKNINQPEKSETHQSNRSNANDDE